MKYEPASAYLPATAHRIRKTYGIPKKLSADFLGTQYICPGLEYWVAGIDFLNLAARGRSDRAHGFGERY
jgi:hypothetical protein